jgi:hypothetical protein
MAKASSSTISTPGMSTKTSKPSSQPPKSTGKQTTLFGFFSKKTATSTPSATPSQTRVEARSTIPLTPLPSSEVGDDDSPTRIPGKQKKVKETAALRTPVTPVARVPEKNDSEMDIDSEPGSTNSRKVYHYYIILIVETSSYQLC